MTLIQRKDSLYYNRPFFIITVCLSIGFLGFSPNRTDEIIIILSIDYHDISLANGKYKARQAAHTPEIKKSKYSSSFNRSGEQSRRKERMRS
jgi:hypothetical protein